MSATQTQRLEDPTSVSDPYFRASTEMWQWIAEVVEEQDENVGWQRQGLVLQSVAKVRQADIHDDPVCTQFGRRTQHGPGSLVAGGG